MALRYRGNRGYVTPLHTDSGVTLPGQPWLCYATAHGQWRYVTGATVAILRHCTRTVALRYRGNRGYLTPLHTDSGVTLPGQPWLSYAIAHGQWRYVTGATVAILRHCTRTVALRYRGNRGYVTPLHTDSGVTLPGQPWLCYATAHGQWRYVTGATVAILRHCTRTVALRYRGNRGYVTPLHTDSGVTLPGQPWLCYATAHGQWRYVTGATVAMLRHCTRTVALRYRGNRGYVTPLHTDSGVTLPGQPWLSYATAHGQWRYVTGATVAILRHCTRTVALRYRGNRGYVTPLHMDSGVTLPGQPWLSYATAHGQWRYVTGATVAMLRHCTRTVALRYRGNRGYVTPLHTDSGVTLPGQPWLSYATAHGQWRYVTGATVAMLRHCTRTVALRYRGNRGYVTPLHTDSGVTLPGQPWLCYATAHGQWRYVTGATVAMLRHCTRTVALRYRGNRGYVTPLHTDSGVTLPGQPWLCYATAHGQWRYVTGATVAMLRHCTRTVALRYRGNRGYVTPLHTDSGVTLPGQPWLCYATAHGQWRYVTGATVAMLRHCTRTVALRYRGNRGYVTPLHTDSGVTLPGQPWLCYATAHGQWRYVTGATVAMLRHCTRTVALRYRGNRGYVTPLHTDSGVTLPGQPWLCYATAHGQWRYVTGATVAMLRHCTRTVALRYRGNRGYVTPLHTEHFRALLCAAGSAGSIVECRYSSIESSIES